MIAPSVTPRKMLGGSNNPAMRLYKFDTDTGQVGLLVNILGLTLEIIRKGDAGR